jgi:steroid delta-isomerase-like uncharacterized protein
MSAEANKAAVRGGIEKVWNENNWAAAVDSYAEDVVVHFGPMPEPIVGRDAFRVLHEMVHVGFPDYSVTIDDIVAEDDRAAARWTLRATHTGEFNGIPATGRSVVVEEFSHFRFEDGKAKEIWLMPNLMSQLQQMGVMPEGPPPKAMLKVMGLVSKIQRLRGRFSRKR